MGALLIADRVVSEARISVPLVGVWQADLIVNGADQLSGQQTLTTGSGAKWTGTVKRPGAFIGSSHLRLVGGAGGMGKTAKPQGYTSPTVRQVLNDLLAAAGESLASDAQASLINTTIESWAILARQVLLQLKALLQTVAPAGTIYQIQPGGALWVGTPAWGTSALKDYAITHEDPQMGRLEVGSDYPDLLPGTVLEDRRISYVEHTISDTKTRTVAMYE